MESNTTWLLTGKRCQYANKLKPVSDFLLHTSVWSAMSRKTFLSEKLCFLFFFSCLFCSEKSLELREGAAWDFLVFFMGSRHVVQLFSSSVLHQFSIFSTIVGFVTQHFVGKQSYVTNYSFNRPLSHHSSFSSVSTCTSHQVYCIMMYIVIPSYGHFILARNNALSVIVLFIEPL